MAVVMNRAAANRTLMLKLIVVAVGMFGFGFALAPFYTKLCEAVGLNRIQAADVVPDNTQVDETRLVTLRFDANLRNDLPWTFQPLTKTVQVHPGQLVHVLYEVKNASDQAILGQAIPSYGPQLAARYCQEARLFLLYAAGAEAARDAADAGGVSDRAGSAGRRQHRDLVLHFLQDRRGGTQIGLMAWCRHRRREILGP